MTLDFANEPEAFAGDCPDQALFLAVVANRLACRIDMTGYGCFRNDPAVPYRAKQIILADDALAILHQVNQQVEYLRADRNRLGASGELPSSGVESVVSKRELHLWRSPNRNHRRALSKAIGREFFDNAEALSTNSPRGCICRHLNEYSRENPSYLKVLARTSGQHAGNLPNN